MNWQVDSVYLSDVDSVYLSDIATIIRISEVNFHLNLITKLVEARIPVAELIAVIAARSQILIADLRQGLVRGLRAFPCAC